MTTDNFDQICANCGKGEESSISLKKCGACMSVRYCSAACQKAHRSQHKKECKKRVAELHEVALFKQPPPPEDCPICFLRVPAMRTGQRYLTCCGKIVCSGCIHAVEMTSDKNLCPFCRASVPRRGEEALNRIKKRVDVGNAQAIYELGCCYAAGLNGLAEDAEKALELWHRAGELGSALANYNIGIAYSIGEGVQEDMKKAMHYYELAAMGGDVNARDNLAYAEESEGNTERALKHFMIAAGGGYNGSLDMIRQFYMRGQAAKDDYTKALRAYQAYLVEIKSDQRDAAASSSDKYRYY